MADDPALSVVKWRYGYAVDRLHAKAYISDSKGRAKSVVLSPGGLEKARALFERYAGTTDG